MRLYVKQETEKAYLLFGEGFVEKWVPKKAVTIKPYTNRLGMHGTSFEMDIEKWGIVYNLKVNDLSDEAKDASIPLDIRKTQLINELIENGLSNYQSENKADELLGFE